MTLKAFSLHKYLFILTLTVSIKQCKKVNLFKPNTPKRQKHRFVSHSPYYHIVRLNGPRPYIRKPRYYENILGARWAFYGANETLESLTAIPYSEMHLQELE